MSESLSAVSKCSTGKKAVFFKAVKFIVISYIVSILLLAILAAVIVYTDVPGGVVDICIKAITLFGAILTGYMMSSCVENHIWIHGLTIGAVNILILIIIGLFIFDANLSAVHTAIMLLCGGICGAFGAMVGIGIRN